jgi:hypothetical protein
MPLILFLFLMHGQSQALSKPGYESASSEAIGQIKPGGHLYLLFSRNQGIARDLQPAFIQPGIILI